MKKGWISRLSLITLSVVVLSRATACGNHDTQNQQTQTGSTDGQTTGEVVAQTTNLSIYLPEEFADFTNENPLAQLLSTPGARELTCYSSCLLDVAEINDPKAALISESIQSEENTVSQKEDAESTDLKEGNSENQTSSNGNSEASDTADADYQNSDVSTDDGNAENENPILQDADQDESNDDFDESEQPDSVGETDEENKDTAQTDKTDSDGNQTEQNDSNAGTNQTDDDIDDKQEAAEAETWNTDAIAWNEDIYATAPVISERDDCIQITFVIKDNLFWSDGNPVTAEDYCLGYAIFAQGDLKDVWQEMPGWLDGSYFSGYETYRTNTSCGEDGVVDKELLGAFGGVHLLNQNSFMLSVEKAAVREADATWADIFGGIPLESSVWLPEGVHLLDDGDGVFLSSLARADYMSQQILSVLKDSKANGCGGAYQCCGAFYVDSVSDNTMILKRNSYQKDFPAELYGMDLSGYDSVYITSSENPKNAAADATADVGKKVVYYENGTFVSTETNDGN